MSLHDLLDTNTWPRYVPPCLLHAACTTRARRPEPVSGSRLWQAARAPLFDPTVGGYRGHDRDTGTHRKTAAEKGTAPSPADVIRRAREAGVQVVDVKFCDLPGTWQHFSLPLKELSESNVQRRARVRRVVDPAVPGDQRERHAAVAGSVSAFVDPCLQVPTLSLTCDIIDPITRESYSRDPRYVAHKAEAYLVKSGIATTAYFGPEAEFYIFNSVRFDQNAHEGYYYIDSEERHLELGDQRRAQPRPSAGTKRAISRCRRWTGCRTCAPRSCWR